MAGNCQEGNLTKKVESFEGHIKKFGLSKQEWVSECFKAG
jgi:hypothetical protein